VFKVKTYYITASAGANGTISPSGSIQANCGSSKTFTITPNTCYQIDSVIVNGSNKGSVTTYTFNNVRADSTIRAVFKIGTYHVTSTAGSHGTITNSGTVTINCGSSQTDSIFPSSGYYTDSVIVNGTNQARTIAYTINNIRGDSTIRATFKSPGYTLTIQITGCGIVSQTPFLTAYAPSTVVSLWASVPSSCNSGSNRPLSPSSGWQFDHWENGASGTANPVNVTMSGNKTVKAVFVYHN